MSRLFDEKQIGAILKRAAEIEGAKDPETTFGLSMQELQLLAADSGIAPESIAAAVAELEVEAETEAHTWWGGPLSLMLDRTIDGEVTQEVWEQMVSEIRRAFKDSGHIKDWGQGYEWRHGGGASSTKAHVTATPRDGHTRIEVFWNEPTMAAPFYVIGSVLSIILAPILFESLGLFTPAGVALYLGLVSSILFLARWSLLRLADKEKRNVRQLMARLEQIAAEAAPHAATTTEALAQETSPATTEPLLSLEEEAEPPDTARAIKKNREQA